MVRKLLLLACAAAMAIIAGCSTSPGSRLPYTAHVDRSGLDPLLDAPIRMRTECKGKELFSAGEKLGGFSFECSELDVVATLNELRDAGWRVEKFYIGKQVVDETESGTPLTINIRKVY